MKEWNFTFIKLGAAASEPSTLQRQTYFGALIEQFGRLT